MADATIASENTLTQFSYLKDKITELVGFNCALYSNSFLVRRVDVRMRATGIRLYNEYAQLLASQPDERTLLLRELTIHTTNFFRDIEAWDVLRRDVIPALVNTKRGRGERVIKIWSAGCSTGEEPVTIAICLFETLGEQLGGFRISILATDLDMETVQRAREGVYEAGQFREMPAAWKGKYFQQLDDGTFTPIPAIKSLISYKTDDIFSPAKPKGIDLLFCRNTVIYFDMESKKRIYEEFFECMQPGGFFVMGKTETMMGPARERFQLFNMHERIFLKSFNNQPHS